MQPVAGPSGSVSAGACRCSGDRTQDKGKGKAPASPRSCTLPTLAPHWPRTLNTDLPVQLEQQRERLQQEREEREARRQELTQRVEEGMKQIEQVARIAQGLKNARAVSSPSPPPHSPRAQAVSVGRKWAQSDAREWQSQQDAV
jgi:hypothetical protein